MPVTKGAYKKLRKDKKRERENKKIENLLTKAFKKALKNPSLENVRKATKIIDKSAKKHIIHKNKAARLKSKISTLLKEKKKVRSKKRA